MHNTIKSLISIQKEITNNNSKAEVIAVTKTFTLDKVLPLIEHGHKHFGENKVQEAVKKWHKIKAEKNDLKLHLIGKLQSNKVKYVLPLFDFIHSLDNIKLAEKIHNEQIKKSFKPKLFIQVNLGDENQKNGISPNMLEEFYKECSNRLDLDIIGLMCIPPLGNTDSFFLKLQELNKSLNLKQLSMGMSSDFQAALKHDSTFVRIGSLIFGPRD
ncbi:MAG: YggS family pyridoxal phosphate-dependent enzyme [Pelagibacteraceae bacterium TMED246]|nr:MAG: YggS family pyridoxal phosphate-dependent enzyme [Pelagibacteraceae bacterium TMED246]|tara:strand:- start:6059 stop:6700 length:642 start_codon:yes stop_codon:yes gene_type:complete